MACKVKSNQHGYLAYQLYWYELPGGTSWEGTALKDNAKNRRSMEARAVLMNEEFEKGIFDYLKWFPNGNKAHLFKRKSILPETIGEYYRVWIERKKPPVVRAGLERDYRDHFRLYILSKFEDTRLAELTPAMLDALRSYLLHERGLSLKSVRNVIDASFRAMYRDARTVDYVPELQGKIPLPPYNGLEAERRNQIRLRKKKGTRSSNNSGQKSPSTTRWSTPCFSVA